MCNVQPRPHSSLQNNYVAVATFLLAANNGQASNGHHRRFQRLQQNNMGDEMDAPWWLFTSSSRSDASLVSGEQWMHSKLPTHCNATKLMQRRNDFQNVHCSSTRAFMVHCILKFHWLSPQIATKKYMYYSGQMISNIPTNKTLDRVPSWSNSRGKHITDCNVSSNITPLETQNKSKHFWSWPRPRRRNWPFTLVAIFGLCVLQQLLSRPRRSLFAT